jgi:hypothetical protein
MFWNNVKIAIRNLRKNKLFAFINIAEANARIPLVSMHRRS